MANQYTSELAEQRAIAVKLLRGGHATVAELAAHFGLARQTVQHWAANIDVAGARSARISRLVKAATPRR